MGLVLDGLLALGMLGVIVSLGLGVYSMVRGGEFNARNGNRFMRWRVWMQAASIGLILVGSWYYSTHHQGLRARLVTLNRIYTRAGDGGDTRLASGETVRKCDLRVEAYGAVDECNAVTGLARLHTREEPTLDPMLARVQNELFDLGADLATPDRGKDLGWAPLRIVEGQVERLEREIDQLNADLAPLSSFVLPGGTEAATWLHLARTVCRRAERIAVDLAGQEGESVGPAALKYLNRLSDFLFVASRWLNARAEGDVLWRPGATR